MNRLASLLQPQIGAPATPPNALARPPYVGTLPIGGDGGGAGVGSQPSASGGRNAYGNNAVDIGNVGRAALGVLSGMPGIGPLATVAGMGFAMNNVNEVNNARTAVGLEPLGLFDTLVEVATPFGEGYGNVGPVDAAFGGPIGTPSFNEVGFAISNSMFNDNSFYDPTGMFSDMAVENAFKDAGFTGAYDSGNFGVGGGSGVGDGGHVGADNSGPGHSGGMW